MVTNFLPIIKQLFEIFPLFSFDGTSFLPITQYMLLVTFKGVSSEERRYDIKKVTIKNIFINTPLKILN
jgi:hypothetical protein